MEFGYKFGERAIREDSHQLGTAVHVHDDVEIGACTTVC